MSRELWKNGLLVDYEQIKDKKGNIIERDSLHSNKTKNISDINDNIQDNSFENYIGLLLINI